MGVPADLAELAASGLVSPAGLARARQDLDLPATGRDGDVPVAGYVAARFGQEVVDRLVDPLLAGVYAGRAEDLSFEATLPALAAESRRHASLAAAAAALLPGPAGDESTPPPGARPAGSTARRRPAPGRRRCSPPSPPGWGRCPGRLPPPPAHACAPARWCAGWPARPAAGG